MQSPSGSKRILIATIGSLGDLHPCLALAVELSTRGYAVTLATTAFYRQKVEALGLRFHSLRPDWDPTDREVIRQCEDLKRGPEVLYRKLLLPHLRNTYDDLLAAGKSADLMVAGELVYAAPLVAEMLKLPWISAILSPLSFFSSHDPSVLVNAPWLIHLRLLGWPAYRVALEVGKVSVRHWSNPVRELRRNLRLSAACDPVFRDKFSPTLVLALFSPLLAQSQPDWPAQSVQPGFLFYDTSPSVAMPPELLTFMESGDPPIVFTQGSTAVHNPGDFYEISTQAARLLGRRAVLVGTQPGYETASTQVLALPYASYSQIFPYAAVNVHQGGSGTVGQALKSGRPMLIVPYGWDQPDNAARIERSGLGLHIPRSKYTATTAAAALDRLLNDPSFTERASKAADRSLDEDGLTVACDAIESVLNAS